MIHPIKLPERTVLKMHGLSELDFQRAIWQMENKSAPWLKYCQAHAIKPEAYLPEEFQLHLAKWMRKELSATRTNESAGLERQSTSYTATSRALPQLIDAQNASGDAANLRVA